MGDASDHADLERFLRSPEGRHELKINTAMLQGKKIVSVSYTNETWAIATTLHLDDGSSFIVFQPSLELGVLRERFESVLEREYYQDHPGRRPVE